MPEKPGYEELEQRVRELEAAAAKQSSLDNTLENLFNLSLDLLCVADFEGYFRLFNEAFENTLGHSTQVLLKTPFIDFVHPDDKVLTLEAVEQLVIGEPVSYFENRCRCKDGSYKWFAWTAVPATDEDFLYASARDITGQKILQRDLMRQRDLLENVLSTVPASIFWKDRNLAYLGANDRFIREAGFQNPQDLIGKTDYDLAWTREQADFYRKCDRRVMDSGEAMLNIEESQLQADGKEVHLLTNKVPLWKASGEVSGMLGVYMDISRQKDAEITLRKSEARLQTMFDSAAEFIFVIDPEGKVLKANRCVYLKTGFEPDEVLGRNIKEFFSDKSQAVCECSFPRLREHGYNRADIEFVCRDGDVIQMECSGTAVPDEEGNFSTFLIIQRDMTERNRVAAALAISERRFRAIFNSSFQFIGILGPDGTLLEANQTALELGGLKQEDVIEHPLWETKWWHYSTAAQDRLKAAVREASQGRSVRYEENVQDRHGAIRTVDFTLKPVLNEDGMTVLILLEGRDISEEKHAEEEMQRHQQEIAHVIRLSTAGEMASGMAHELNQPLAALVSYCGTAIALVNSMPTPLYQLREILECASEQAHRAGSIIRNLREFVSKEDNRQQRIELDQVIRDLDTLLGAELKDAAVTVDYHLHGQGRRVMANKVQLQQVLVNLVKNSVDAIRANNHDDGRVILETRLLADAMIEVTITDNGPGIAADMMGKMFNPFQTSKVSGMGMGLSISRSIIEAQGGRIWADEQRHDGASFGFCLPLSD
ncbi:MAG: PAS domain S-box protein [Gammaproteobacteria bacterium]|nr:PAS domain S-box protein [Gammaproteobacteria bacterium]